MVARTLEVLSSVKDRRLLLKCGRMPGFLLSEARKGPSSRDKEEGGRGSSELWWDPRCSSRPSAAGDVRELLGIASRVSGPFWGSGGEGGIFLRRRSRKGPQLALGRISWFSQLLQVLLRDSTGTSGTCSWVLRDSQSSHACHEVAPRVSPVAAGAEGPPLELRPEPKGILSGLTWISVFLWGTPKGSQALSHVEPCKSAPS